MRHKSDRFGIVDDPLWAICYWYHKCKWAKTVSEGVREIKLIYHLSFLQGSEGEEGRVVELKTQAQWWRGAEANIIVVFCGNSSLSSTLLQRIEKVGCVFRGRRASLLVSWRLALSFLRPWDPLHICSSRRLLSVHFRNVVSVIINS